MAQASKGSFSSRYHINVMTVILGFLFYWLLGFVLDDLSSVKQPNYDVIQAKYVSQDLLTQEQNYLNDISNQDAQVNHLTDNRQYIKNNADNLKVTIDQMLELQKSSLQKNIPISQKEKEGLNQSQATFLSYQEKFQGLNSDILEQQKSKYILEQKLKDTEKKIASQRKLANDEYSKLSNAHNFSQAILQVSVLIALLGASLWLLRRYANHNYIIILKAFIYADVIKTFFTIFDFFPQRFFKYILIIALISLFIYLTIRLIKSIKSPKIEMLIKQYREAYEHFLCPKCDFPIRTGPRKYLFWTRRSNLHLTLPKSSVRDQVQAYYCPACGTDVFNECGTCHKTRYSLLPHCNHCGKENNVKS